MYRVLLPVAACGLLWVLYIVCNYVLLCIINHANTFDKLNIHHVLSVLFCL